MIVLIQILTIVQIIHLKFCTYVVLYVIIRQSFKDFVFIECETMNFQIVLELLGQHLDWDIDKMWTDLVIERHLPEEYR